MTKRIRTTTLFITTLVLIAGACLVAGALLYYSSKGNDQTDKALKDVAKSSPKISNDPNGAPSGGSIEFPQSANQDSKGKTCRDVSRTDVSSVIGEVSSMRQEPFGRGPLNIAACVYESPNMNAKIIVYGFSSSGLARKNQDTFKSGSLKVAVADTHVIAVEVEKDGRYDLSLTDRLLDKVKAGLN